uniref:Uncharacterized protein n=1 Tax=Rhizophora mucronata TaxID=61149 RepID=A0A2P2Q452_RHIMU
MSASRHVINKDQFGHVSNSQLYQHTYIRGITLPFKFHAPLSNLKLNGTKVLLHLQMYLACKLLDNENQIGILIHLSARMQIKNMDHMFLKKVYCLREAKENLAHSKRERKKKNVEVLQMHVW